MDIERIFPSKVSKEFTELMKKAEWRELTCQQLNKDFMLSGNALPELDSSNLSLVLTRIVSAINQAKSNKAMWDNLNYRIDIPQLFEPSDIQSDQLARIYLLRCFQKVWTRKHFNEMQ